MATAKTEIANIKRAIRGEEATFVIFRAKHQETGRETIAIEGFFRSKNGNALLFFVADAADYDQEALKELIGSIE